MSKDLNVLVFPGGTEIGHEINSALRYCRGVNLYSAGTDVSNHAPYIFKHHAVVPHYRDPDWTNAINEVAARWSIDYIYPAHDDVLTHLVRRKDEIRTNLVASPERTCEIARSKSATYATLKDAVPTPRVYANADHVKELPVFIKPDAAQGSADVHLVENGKQLDYLLSTRNDYIILEYLPGREFTVDCFCDREQGLLYCCGRQRIRTRAGISMHTRICNEPRFKVMAVAISKHLPLQGAWFFQVKEAQDGTLKLMEFAPRIGGAMALDRVRGVNLPFLTLLEHQREQLIVLPNAYEVEMDRSLVNRYSHNLQFETVFVDLDDTLLHKGQVNTLLVQFLYQCVNQRKDIILVTKHRGNLESTLKRHKLDTLFDRVVQLTGGELKPDFISTPNAILIDDSFSERCAVNQRHGIPTFDSSMIEMLIDDRVE